MWELLFESGSCRYFIWRAPNVDHHLENDTIDLIDWSWENGGQRTLSSLLLNDQLQIHATFAIYSQKPKMTLGFQIGWFFGQVSNQPFFNRNIWCVWDIDNIQYLESGQWEDGDFPVKVLSSPPCLVVSSPSWDLIHGNWESMGGDLMARRCRELTQILF